MSRPLSIYREAEFEKTKRNVGENERVDKSVLNFKNALIQKKNRA